MICEIWTEFFAHEVSPDDDFFELGGDSVAIVETVIAARQRGLTLRSSEALRNPTPARLAEYLTLGAGAAALDVVPPNAFAALRAHTTTSDTAGHAPVEPASHSVLEAGSGVPLYLVHSDDYRQLEQDAVSHWDSAGPVRTFRVSGILQGAPTVADIASDLIKVLRNEQATGPYRLAGFEFGAVVALEMGHQLRQDGDDVDFVALICPPPLDPASATHKTIDELLDERVHTLARRFALTGEENSAAVLAAMREAGWYDDAVTADELPTLQASWARLASAVQEYEPPATDFPTVLVQDIVHASAMDRGWDQALRDVKALWLDHGTSTSRSVIRDPRTAAFLREVLSS